jgi:hypothetical protein
MPVPEQQPTNLCPQLGGQPYPVPGTPVQPDPTAYPGYPQPTVPQGYPQNFVPQQFPQQAGYPQPGFQQPGYSQPQPVPAGYVAPGYPQPQNTIPQQAYPNVGVQPRPVPLPVPLPASTPGINQSVVNQTAAPRPVPIPRRDQATPDGSKTVTQPNPVRPGSRPVPVSSRPIPLQKKEGDIRVSEHVDDEDVEDVKEVVVKNMPPVLISTVVHIIIVLALALMIHTVAGKKTEVITVSIEEPEIFAEKLGEQLFQDSNMVNIATPDTTKIELADVNLPPVPDPFAAPSPAELVPDGVTAASFTDAPINGIADGRSIGSKKGLLGRFGGNATTEQAVRRALEWLKRNQNKQTGAWSLVGPYKDGGAYENPVAATAMALLAFQGYGTTDKTGDFKEQVALGWKALLKMQDPDGLFTSPGMGNHNHLFYSHGQAMIAVCEMYAMSLAKDYPDPKQREIYKDAAQRAINYAVKTQDPQKGGWRYLPGNDADTSVTGWLLMGLMSGKMAGLDVPESTLQKITAYLDAAQQDGGATYSYRPGYGAVTAAVSAEGLLMRQYLGWDRNDERLVNGVRKILGYPMDPNDWKVYYWYYATQVCHHMEGPVWDEWNKVMRQMLPENQIRKGPEEGSWEPSLDEWGPQGGRLYMTCFCCYMLEVYYRHMPLYDKIYEQKAKAATANAGR